MSSLTQKQRQVLAHVVVDPDAWQEHNVKSAPSLAEASRRLKAKVARWKPSYEAEKDKEGYMTRAEREQNDN